MLQHAAGVAHGGAGGHRPERDDLRDAVAAVLLAHVVDDAVAAGDGEVDVHVGHRLAARVEEPLEEEVVADRVEIRDLEGVRDDAPGGRAAARADADPVLLREADEVGDDQEVVGEAHLLDRLELELQPLAELRRDRPVALLGALLAELDEVLEGVAAVGRGEVREQDPIELDLDVAPLGHLERASQRVVAAGEVGGHLLRRLEVELVGLEAPAVRVLERVAGLDAEQRLVGLRILVPQVVDVAGGDRRQATLLGELDELRRDPLLHLEVRVLELDVDVVAAEDLLEPVELCLGVALAVLFERLADATGEAPRERDQPRAVALEQLPVDARLVVVALEIAERGELDQVRVALVRRGEEREMRLPLLLRVPVVGDVDLAADDRLDPFVPARPCRGRPRRRASRGR